MANQTTSVTVPDVEQLGELTVYKEGQVLCGADVTDTGTIFQYENRRQVGAVYEVYAGEDGTAVFTADLPIGFSYSIKEEQAPEGYLRNTEDIYSFKFSYTNDEEAVVAFTHTFVNKRVNAETNASVAQVDATLDKAVYGLYAREDIVHPDGATGMIYKAGEKVASLTTDENGGAVIGNLYLGSY